MPNKRTLRLAFALVCAQALASAAPRAARADETTAEEGTPGDRAVALFKRSEESYKAGRFDEAVRLLREAYGLKPEPVLLWNLGRCYEALADLPGAIDAYTRYLAVSSEKDRPSVERRLATLRRQLAERAALELRHQDELRRLSSAQSVERARLSEARRGATLLLPKVIVGTGAAGLVAGGVLAAVAVTRQGAAERDVSELDAQHDLERGRTFATGANVGFVAGGVLAAVGVVWWIVAARGSSDDRAARPRTLTWTF